MILQVYFQGKQVLLDVGSGLVFDGSAFVDPATAKYVELSVAGTAIAQPETYPIRGDGQPLPSESFTNYWVCKVVGVHSPNSIIGAGDVITVPDPANNGAGGCICGITCMGTAVQNVNVFNVPTLL